MSTNLESVISIGGSIASFAGLGVSIWVLVKVRQLSRSYLIRVRVPQLVGELDGLTDELLTEFNGPVVELSRIDLLVSRIEAKIESLTKTMGPRVSKPAKEAKAALQVFWNGNKGKQEARALHLVIYKFLTKCHENVRDIEWEQ